MKFDNICKTETMYNCPDKMGIKIPGCFYNNFNFDTTRVWHLIPMGAWRHRFAQPTRKYPSFQMQIRR